MSTGFFYFRDIREFQRSCSVAYSGIYCASGVAIAPKNIDAFMEMIRAAKGEK